MIPLDTIPLDLPTVPGISFRLFRSDDDFPAMLSIIHASRRADGLDEARTLENIIQEYRNARNMELARDVLLAQAEGRNVALNRLSWKRENAGTWVYEHWSYIHPEFRGRGITTALLRYAEGRLRDKALRHVREDPDAADAPRVFQTFVAASQAEYAALLERQGYAPARFFVQMVRPTLDDIEDYPLPHGLIVRPARPDEYRQVWQANNEAFRDHWGESTAHAVTEEDFQRALARPSCQPHLWQIAWDGDRVAGMVLNFIDAEENAFYQRRRGFTEDICVLAPYRRRGLARALLALSLRLLKEQGMQEAALGVDAENTHRALELYASAGFKTVRQIAFYRKGIK